MEIKTPTTKHRNQRTQKTPSITVLRNCPKELIVGDIDDGVQTRRRDMDISSRNGMAYYQHWNLKTSFKHMKMRVGTKQ